MNWTGGITILLLAFAFNPRLYSLSPASPAPLCVPSATVFNGSGKNPNVTVAIGLPVAGGNWQVKVDLPAGAIGGYVLLKVDDHKRQIPDKTPYGEVLGRSIPFGISTYYSKSWNGLGPSEVNFNFSFPAISDCAPIVVQALVLPFYLAPPGKRSKKPTPYWTNAICGQVGV